MWKLATFWSSNYGDTPLHSEIRSYQTGDSYLDYVESLLKDIYSNINVPNLEGETPLHLAVQCHTSKLAELLLRHGANVNVVNIKGETPLHLVVKNNRCNYKLLKLLLEYGANVKAKTKLDGNTALHYAALYSSTIAYYEDYKDECHRNSDKDENRRIVDLLVEYGSYINASNIEGNTPLHLAVLSNSQYPPIFDLLHNGSDVDAANFKGDTPLSLCLQESRSDILILYLRAFLQITKRDINAVNSEGNTLLHLAVRSKACAKVWFIKMLLDHGADVDKKDANGENVYEAFCRSVAENPWTRSTDPMLEILLQSKEREQRMHSSLHVASLYHKVDTVKKLLRAGAFVNDKRTFGHPPLFYALVAPPVNINKLNGKCSTVELLLHHGADVNHKLYRGPSRGPDVPMLQWHDMHNIDYKTSVLSLMLHGMICGWGWGDNIKTDPLESRIYDIYNKQLVKLWVLDSKGRERGSKAKVLSDYNLCKLNRDKCNSLNKIFRVYISCCYRELEEMRMTKIGKSKISFLDVLLATKEETKIYANNKVLIKALNAKKYIFPIYQGMLNAKIAKELDSRKHDYLDACRSQSLFVKLIALIKKILNLITQNEIRI